MKGNGFRRAYVLVLVLVLIVWNGRGYGEELCKVNKKAILIKTQLKEKGSALFINDVVLDEEGNYLFCGNIFNINTLKNYAFVAKFNTKGEKIWIKELGKKAMNSSCQKLLALGDSNYLVLGYVNASYQYGKDFSQGWIIKFNSSGKIIWDKALKLYQDLRIMSGYSLNKLAFIVGRIREGDRYNSQDNGFFAKLETDKGDIVQAKKVESKNWFDSIYMINNSDILVWNSNWIGLLDLQGDLKFGKMLKDMKCSEILAINTDREKINLLCKNFRIIYLDHFGNLKNVIELKHSVTDQIIKSITKEGNYIILVKSDKDIKVVLVLYGYNSTNSKTICQIKSLSGNVIKFLSKENNKYLLFVHDDKTDQVFIIELNKSGG